MRWDTLAAFTPTVYHVGDKTIAVAFLAQEYLFHHGGAHRRDTEKNARATVVRLCCRVKMTPNDYIRRPITEFIFFSKHVG